MKATSLIALSLLLAPPLFADTGQRLIPAGSLVSCTTGDGKISSSTTAVGDPVLCKVEHKRGDFMLPYGSYLGGEFAEYKDPGHFVGKGWMELDFDRLYVGDQVYPIDAKVVDVPGYKIDRQGRILGKGHEGRDIALWSIPVLWPIDLLMLPMRGPRPTLKAETALTLRIMDDLQVPVVQEPYRDPSGLIPRGGGSSSAPEPPPPTQQPESQPQNSYAPEPPQPPMQEQYPPQQQYAYAPEPPPQPIVMTYAVPVPYPVPYPAVVAYAPPMAVVPPVVAYGSVGMMVGPGYYGPRYYAGPPVRAYGYAYGGRVAVARAGVIYGRY